MKLKNNTTYNAICGIWEQDHELILEIIIIVVQP